MGTNIVKLMVDKPDEASVEVVTAPGEMVLRCAVAFSDVASLSVHKDATLGRYG